MSVKLEKPYDCLDNIIAYESGELDDAGAIRLFQHLIDTGLAWSLQGHYGRAFRRYISDNYSPEFRSLAEWKKWAEINMDELAPEFCEAERDWLPPLIMGIPVGMQP